MKKLIYYGIATFSIGIFLFSCTKEKIELEDGYNYNKKSYADNDNDAAYRLPAGTKVSEEKRAYTWVNDKLDCSQEGSGCIVESKLTTKNGEIIDLSVSQILKLIEIGKGDLNQAFLQNELKFEFPSLYNQGYITSGIATGKINVAFEFPYLIVTDNDLNEQTIYNYQSILADPEVIAAMQGAGSYTKKVELNTDPNVPAVWKCTEPGDNCKVSSVRFNATWLKDNPSYLFVPNNETVVNSMVDDNKRVVVETSSGNKFGVEF